MMKVNEKKSHREAGLTLIEVLIVVFIISIVLAILIPNYAASTKSAKEKLCVTAVQMVNAQIELYRIDHPDKALEKEPDKIFQQLINGGYLRQAPVCPTEGEIILNGEGFIEWLSSAKSSENEN